MAHTERFTSRLSAGQWKPQMIAQKRVVCVHVCVSWGGRAGLLQRALHAWSGYFLPSCRERGQLPFLLLCFTVSLTCSLGHQRISIPKLSFPFSSLKPHPNAFLPCPPPKVYQSSLESHKVPTPCSFLTFYRFQNHGRILNAKVFASFD